MSQRIAALCLIFFALSSAALASASAPQSTTCAAHTAITEAPCAISPQPLDLLVLNGEREPITIPTVWIRVLDANNKLVFHGLVQLTNGVGAIPNQHSFSFPLKISVSQKGYRASQIQGVLETAGQISITLVDKHATFDFLYPSLEQMQAAQPQLSALIVGFDSQADAENRYSVWKNTQQKQLAALLNLSTALEQLPSGSLLPYYKEVVSIQQDRFFAYADADLLAAVQSLYDQGLFDRQGRIDLMLHHGGTLSFKEMDLPEANLQITFHQRDTKIVNGRKLVLVETDIDYFKTFWKHMIEEVCYHIGTRRKSSPTTVYRFRSNEQKPGVVFNPPYRLTAISTPK
jgi:hypothetical protein